MVIPQVKRNGRRVALVAWYPPPDPALPPFIPNMGIYRIAAALQSLGLDDLELRIWDEKIRDPHVVADEIAAFDPDIVGGSAFLWSLMPISEVFDSLVQDDPSRLFVLGGPSARPNMLEHPPYRSLRSSVDVLVEGEGEQTIQDIVRASDRSSPGLQRIVGTTLRSDAGWVRTKQRPRLLMDEVPSPYLQKLIPRGGIGLLETYRGCPLTCSFCEWGSMGTSGNVLSAAAIKSEFLAMKDLGLNALLISDAGLNLNSAAFDSIALANAETGFLKDRSLIAEVYPRALAEKHFRFLESVGAPHIGVGLQTFDESVLRHIDRKFDPSRVGSVLDNLRSVAAVTGEIIMGLPGDTPRQFLLSFERARSLGIGLRVYHCAVLPSGLMARAPVSDMLDYDPVTLKMRSCRGWPNDAIQAMADRLTQLAIVDGGASGDYFWVFPPS